MTRRREQQVSDVPVRTLEDAEQQIRRLVQAHNALLGRVRSLETRRGPFSRRVELKEAATSVRLGGLNGDLHRLYRVRFGGEIDDDNFTLYLNWNGETSGYGGTRHNLFNNTGAATSLTRWELTSNNFGTAGGAQFAGHGELVATRNLIILPGLSTRTRSGALTGSTAVGSQTFDGELQASSPDNLAYLELEAGGTIEFSAGSYLEVVAT